MLRQLFKNKKAQNTAEYALLIALVIAGVVAMQTYAQRALQAAQSLLGSYQNPISIDGRSRSTMRFGRTGTRSCSRLCRLSV